MELRALGAIVLSTGGQPQPLAPTQRLLLAVLLVHRRRVVSADVLGDALWGDTPPPTARATLQTHLSKLRRALGDDPGLVLVNRPPGYVLDVAETTVDVDRFEAAVDAARLVLVEEPGTAVTELDRALSLWGGPAFSEFASTSWACAAAVRLDELRLVAFEMRNDARLAIGARDAVIGELEGLTREHPLRERFWEQLMVALHQSGRQAEALRVGQALRRYLRDELGLEPSATFRAVEAAVAVDDESVRPSAPLGGPGASRSGPSATGPIGQDAPASPGAPRLASELVGRAEDLERVTVAMATARLVTLTGPGGVGKSTLAVEVVRRVVDRFDDGVRFVELATVQDAGAVMAAVAQSLGVERRSERSLAESISAVLGSRRLLLVLDNCEHVIGAVGELVSRIVRWCPEVRLLATSREPIGVAGETVWSVSPLGVPARSDLSLDELRATPAVQVFLARAVEAAPSFEMTERSAPAVAELCIALDGLPLALELAAARMASMSPVQLADRLHERFALLGGPSGRDPRHRTLVDLVQWSYELLSDKERTLLARVSVFAGGFDLEAAERVCGIEPLAPAEVAHLLVGLVDKSLIVANQVDGQMRYTQLETLRHFGAERLRTQPEAEAVRRGHRSAFVDLTEQGAAALKSAEEALWTDRMEADWGNLRVAVHFAVDAGDVDSTLRLVASGREVAFRRIRYELVDWAETAVRLDGADDHPLLPTVLGIVGYGCFVRGELDRAVELAERAIVTRERLALPSCGLPERVLGNAVFYRGEHVDALRWMERMVAVARDSGIDGRLAHALYMRSVAQTSIGDPEGGAVLALEASVVADRSGSPTALAQAAYAGGLAIAAHDVDGAVALLDEAVALAESVGNRWMRAFAMTEALWLRAGRGEVLEALRGYREVVETWFQGGDWANQWLSLRHVAGVFADLGRDADAALLFGAVEAAGASDALPLSPADADDLSEGARALTERIGPVAAAEAARRGAMMRDEATVASALQTIDDLT